MKNLLISLISLFLLSPLPAQQSKIDSLENLLKAEQPDTMRYKRMAYLCWAKHQVGKIDESAQIANDIIHMSDSLVRQNEKFWNVAKAYGLGILGIIASGQSEFDKSVALHEQVLEIRKKYGTPDGVMDTYTNIGVDYWFLGKYPEALQYYLKALAIAEEQNDKEAIGDLYNNIGGMYEHMEQFDEALSYYQKSLEIRLLFGDKAKLAGSYNNIGNIHDYKSHWKESLEYHGYALEMYREVGNMQGMNNVYQNLANTYSNMNDFAMEVKYRDSTLYIAKALGDKFGLASAYNSLGFSYVDQKQYAKAFQYLDAGLNLAKAIKAKDRIMEAYEGLAEAAAGKGDFASAFGYQKQYTDLRDTLLNEDNQAKIADMKEKYESEKKDAQIALLNKNAELTAETNKRHALTRNIAISAGILLVLILFARYRIVHKLSVEKIRNRISQDLHDEIGSTLSSISISSITASLMKPEKINEIQSTLQHIGTNSRKAMENMSDIVWAINPKDDSFRNMIERLQIFAYKLLDASNIQFNMQIPEAIQSVKLDIEQRKNIYLILREAINNVAKYSKASNCELSAAMEHRKINLRLTDNGIGFDRVENSLGGNGLINMRHRAEELRGIFNINSDLNKGTSVSLQFSYA